MSESISEEQTALLCHALGIDERRREPYRNHFLADFGHLDNNDLIALVRAGHMTACVAPAMWGSGIVYVVTDAGRQIAINSLPEPKKLSRSKAKYQDFLDSDGWGGDDFASFLGIRLPEREYGSWESRGLIRFRSPRATGEWCKTVKAAKASYKTAMKANKESSHV